MMMISHNMSLTIARAKILFTPQIHKLGDAYGRHYAVNKNRHNRFGSTHDYLYFITRSFNFSLLRDVHTPFFCVILKTKQRVLNVTYRG